MGYACHSGSVSPGLHAGGTVWRGVVVAVMLASVRGVVDDQGISRSALARNLCSGCDARLAGDQVGEASGVLRDRVRRSGDHVVLQSARFEGLLCASVGGW
jgi:hypothetical protein